jgi:hypothetical protein
VVTVYCCSSPPRVSTTTSGTSENKNTVIIDDKCVDGTPDADTTKGDTEKAGAAKPDAKEDEENK